MSISFREDISRTTETPYVLPVKLEDLLEKLRNGQNLTFEDLKVLVETVRTMRENDIPHLNERIAEIELANKRSAKRELLGLTLMLWVATPIAFLSIPLIGVACALVASFSTFGYIKAKTRVT